MTNRKAESIVLYPLFCLDCMFVESPRMFAFDNRETGEAEIVCRDCAAKRLGCSSYEDIPFDQIEDLMSVSHLAVVR